MGDQSGGPLWGASVGDHSISIKLNFTDYNSDDKMLGGPASEILARGPLTTGWGAPLRKILARGPLWGAPLRKFWPVDPSPLAPGGPRFGNFGPCTPHHWPLGGPASEILARAKTDSFEEKEK